MPKGDVETVFADGIWTNQVQGEDSSGVFFLGKEQAAAAGRELARRRGVEHIVKEQDITIDSRDVED